MKKKHLKYEKPVLHNLMQKMGMDVAAGANCMSGSGPPGTGHCKPGNVAGKECQSGQNASWTCNVGSAADERCRNGNTATRDCRNGVSADGSICSVGTGVS